MSGGSYDNLFLKDAVEIIKMRDVLRAMADRLYGLDYAQDAAVETEELLSLIDQYEIKADTYIERLKEVWKAVEYWDSCDSSEDALKKTLEKYGHEKANTNTNG